MANILTPSHLLPAEWIFSLLRAFLYSGRKPGDRHKLLVPSNIRYQAVESPFLRQHPHSALNNN